MVTLEMVVVEVVRVGVEVVVVKAVVRWWRRC